MARVEIVGAYFCGGDRGICHVREFIFKNSNSLAGWPAFVGIDRSEFRDRR